MKTVLELLREVLSSVSLGQHPTSRINQQFVFTSERGRPILGTIIEIDYNPDTQTLLLVTAAHSQLTCNIEWTKGTRKKPARPVLQSKTEWTFLAAGRGRHMGTTTFP